MKEKLMRFKHSFGLAIRLIIAVAILVVIAVNFKTLQSLDVRALVESAASLPLQLAVVIGIYAVKGIVLVVPASLVYIAVGVSLPTGWAVAVNIAGIFVELSVTYLMGIILGGPYVTKKLSESKSGKRILNTYEKHDKSGIFIMRIIGLPIDFCSLFLGAMRSRFFPYLLTSAAGILPRVILFTILGDKVYDLIPMQYVVIAGTVIIAIALIVWIVKYLAGSLNKEANYGKPVYTPLCEEKRGVIIDTDIGPDCDDAGALAVLFEYLKKYDIPLLGIFNCTTNVYGNAAIRAICEYYGLDEPVLGCNKGAPMLPDDSKYSKAITKAYCKYENSACAAENAQELYTRILSDAAKNSVTIITIGTFTNIAAALNSDSVLFNEKVHSVISMAGKYPKGKEFNIEKDPISASAVMEKYRNLHVFSGHEVGKDIMTGFAAERAGNPVYDCYRLHCGGELPYLNPSYDLTAVQYAFEGNSSFYSLSKPMSVSVDINGEFSTAKDKFSNKRFIIKEADDEEIADYLNALLDPPAPAPRIETPAAPQVEAAAAPTEEAQA